MNKKSTPTDWFNEMSVTSWNDSVDSTITTNATTKTYVYGGAGSFSDASGISGNWRVSAVETDPLKRMMKKTYGDCYDSDESRWIMGKNQSSNPLDIGI